MPRAARLALFWLAAVAALALTHYPLLRLPFYWDELGQFIPAALDIFHRLAWVPFTTVPNVHPPGLMAYLALFWRIAGFSVLHTRLAMLLVSAAALLAAWMLALHLSGKRTTAWVAVLFLFCCPLFFAQAALAQLDLPAMLFTTAALALFLKERYRWCVLVCCLGVMVKETAIVAPALFGFVMLTRRRTRQALLFTLPLIPLAIWLFILKRATGHLFGSPEFTDYNLFYPLNPVRLALALFRRIYYLFIGSGHVIGTAALIWLLARRRGQTSPQWRLAAAFVACHVAMICVLGGAVLERYLLPALPVLYAAFGWAITALPGRLGRFTVLALAACLAIACFRNPPYPFPMENNLAWTTFVALHQQAAEFSEAALADTTIATSFPLAGALERPEMGYVSRPLHVLHIDDFRESNITQKVRGHAGALIEYSVNWDPLSILQKPRIVSILQRFYGYVPQVAPADVPRLTGMRSVFRTCAQGQCVEVFKAP